MFAYLMVFRVVGSFELRALPLQEKELAKEMDGLSLAQASSSAAGGAAGATDGVKKYNKSSFFDEISCDVLDRAAGTRDFFLWSDYGRFVVKMKREIRLRRSCIYTAVVCDAA